MAPLVAPTQETPNPVDEPDRRAQFAATFLPHLPAAYNLARWLTRDGHDAEDVVQEAYLRAFRSSGGFRGGDGRAWFLAIVRNTCLTWLRQNRPAAPTVPFDEARHGGPAHSDRPVDGEALGLALEELPAEFREAVVLRELEGLSYKEIAAVTGVPIGTVMSRLSRGRDLLRRALAGRGAEEV
ncbi:MAG TPA: sigma-70 family RNA polymerase sigma factor [Gemmataceae bacterium]